jgi:hypothetical protein
MNVAWLCSELELYVAIAGLSYRGDPRMLIAENPDKVVNMVSPNITHFRAIYSPLLSAMPSLTSVRLQRTSAVDAMSAVNDESLRSNRDDCGGSDRVRTYGIEDSKVCSIEQYMEIVKESTSSDDMTQSVIFTQVSAQQCCYCIDSIPINIVVVMNRYVDPLEKKRPSDCCRLTFSRT